MLLGPAWIAAVVLAAAGLGKLMRPAAATDALRSLGLPHGHGVVRLLGAGELAVAVAAVVFGGPLFVLLAAAYAALAVAAERLRRRPAGADGGCGCFGRSAAPVGPTHVAVNVVAAAVATGAALGGTDPLSVAWPGLPVAGIAHLVLVATGAAAVVALLTVLPETRLAARPLPARDPRVHLFGPTITRRPAPATAASAAGQEEPRS